MADDKRITELPDASLPIASGVKFEAVQGGVNVKVDANDMPGSGASVPDADATTKGIAKLYTSTGSDTDGSMDRNSITNAVNAKVVNGINNGATTTAPSEDAVFDALALKQAIANTASALTDGASIDITGAKHTLTTDEATITFSQSFTGDFTNIDVTFNTTAATWTFPAGSLCVIEGSASGNNTATVAAVSGDKIVISIWFVSSGNYRVVIKNFGQ